jgi:hypothetical protein
MSYGRYTRSDNVDVFSIVFFIVVSLIDIEVHITNNDIKMIIKHIIFFFIINLL